MNTPTINAKGDTVYNKLAGLIAPLVSQSSDTVDAEVRYFEGKFRALITVYMQTPIAVSTCRLLTEQIAVALTDLYTLKRIEFLVHNETQYIATYTNDNRTDEYIKWEEE